MASSDENGLGDRESALIGIGELWCNGVNIDWPAVQAADQPRRLPLPTYTFERSRHWIEAPAPMAVPAAGHENEGRRPWQEWFYVADWRPRRGAADPGAAAAVGPATARGQRFGRSLADELRSRDGALVTVHGVARSSTSWVPVTSPSIPRRRPTTSAWSNRCARCQPAESVLHGWTATEDAAAWGETEERAFYSLLWLAQAWGRSGSEAPSELCLVSSGLWKVGGEPSGQPWRALALGPMRVIPSEFPSLRTRVIDVGLPSGEP